MLKQKLAVAIAAIAVVARASAPVPGTITFGWDNQQGIDAFKLYGTNNVSGPTSGWPLLTTVAGTNFTVQITVTPGQMFFFVTASNFWGESGPSNIASVPNVATNPSVRILGH